MKIFISFFLFHSFYVSLAQIGSLDPTFGNNGRAQYDLGVNGPVSTNILSVALQVDGKLVVAGYIHNGSDSDFMIARLNQDGSYDHTFGTNGKKVVAVGPHSDQATGVAIQPDGKIVVAGSIFNSISYIAAIRLNADGSLDASFGEEGKTILPLTITSVNAKAMTLQADGKILIAADYMNAGEVDLAVVRLNASGTLDADFGSNGVFTRSTGGGNEESTSIKIHPDGKIVITGYTSAPSYSDPYIVKLDTDGTSDDTFNSDGLKIIPMGEYGDMPTDMIILSDGKMLFSGITQVASGNTEILVFKVNPDGTFDNSFDGDGQAIITLGSSVNRGRSIALQADGKILIGADYFTGSNYDIAIVRLNSNGSLDNTYNGSGKQSIPISSDDDNVKEIIIDHNGKAVAVGYAETSPQKMLMVRLDINGVLDNTFDSDGIIFTEGQTSVDILRTAPIVTNEKIITVGTVVGNDGGNKNYDVAILKMNKDGSPDVTFATGGINIRSLGTGDDFPVDFRMQSDGKIVIAGHYYNVDNNDLFIMRLNPDGSPDLTFDSDGVGMYDVASWHDYASAVRIQSDGKIVIAGHSSEGGVYKYSMIRVNANGSLDNTFDSDGKIVVGIAGSNTAHSMEIQPDGKILLAGQNSVIRVNPNGSLDNTFDSDGKLTTSGFVYDIEIQQDSKILFGGSRSIGIGNDCFLSRLNNDGSIDNAFGINGTVIVSLSDESDEVHSIYFQEDKILLSAAARIQNPFFPVLVRLNSNGSLDNTFGPGGKVILPYPELWRTVISDNKMILAGTFAGDFSFVRTYLKNKSNLVLANTTKYYGDAPFYWTATTQNSGNLSYQTLSGNAATISPADGFVTVHVPGSVNVKVFQEETLNYYADSSTATLTVNKAPLTVTGNDETKNEGDANPAFTVAYSGFVNGEDESVLTGSPEITTTATDLSPAGTYPISPALGTLSADNYEFNFIAGTLEIIPVTGISGPAAFSTIKVFPNPANGTFMIESPDTIEEVKLISLSGQTEVFQNTTCIQTTMRGLILVIVRSDKNVYPMKIKIND